MNQQPPPQPVTLLEQDGVALIRIDNPPVNALSSAVLEALWTCLDKADADPKLQALVLVGAGRNFIAGADISRLEALAGGQRPQSSEVSLSAICARLESGPKPSVAALDGFALGGGFELAMGCNARVATARARVGLPELRLGLIPGAGGTQRLPRLVGAARAARWMLESEQQPATDACDAGAIDEVVADADQLLKRASELALELASGARARLRALELDERLEPRGEIPGLLAAARHKLGSRARNVQYPEACLEAIEVGCLRGAEAGLKRERELFQQLLDTPVARGLMHLFFAERAAGKIHGITDQGLKARSIQRLGVLGGGTMGSGIVTAALAAGLEVRLKELDSERAEAGRSRVEKNFARDVQKGRISAAVAEERLSRLSLCNDYAGFEQLDLVVEAATENEELKQRLFADLVAATRADCLLATNTSTIDIDRVSAGLNVRERTLGLHFFSPAHIMKLVEVVRTEHTAPQTLVDALGFCRRINKTAVTVGNCTGFLVNRIFMPYGQINGFLIDHGIDPYRIDQALFDFGMPMGPNRMGDLAGIDVSVSAGAIMDAAYRERSYRSALRQFLADAGRLGEKTGKGHYLHRDGKAVADPELAGFVRRARQAAGNPEPLTLSDEQIVRITLSGVINEACRCLEENIVVRPSDVDVASALGMGFPPYRGGPLKWSDEVGASRILADLDEWHARFGLELFRPSEYLRRAVSGKRALSRAA